MQRFPGNAGHLAMRNDLDPVQHSVRNFFIWELFNLEKFPGNGGHLAMRIHVDPVLVK